MINASGLKASRAATSRTTVSRSPPSSIARSSRRRLGSTVSTPTSSTPTSLVCHSQERQRNAPTEGNLASGRPARNNPIEPPTKVARGNKGGDSSGLPPHAPTSERTSPAKATLLEAEEAAALASSVASTDLQFVTTLVKSLEASATERADEIAADAASDFETAFSRRKMAIAEGKSNGSAGNNHDLKHLKKHLTDAAEHRRGQLRQLRHALRGDVQVLVREGKVSKDEAARTDAAVEGAFKRASAALEEAASAASERVAKLAG